MPNATPSPLTRPLLVALGAVVVVTGIGLLITMSPAWSTGELQVVAAVHAVGNAVFDAVAVAINVGFGTKGAVFVALAVLLIVFAISRSWRLALRTGVLIAVPWVIAEAVKYVVRRPRPDPSALGHMLLPSPMSFSFPSGHTAFAAALGCAVVLVLAAGRARTAAIAIAAAVVLITAWSRVYLGVHYPTDVLAAMLLVPLVAVAVLRASERLPLLRDAPVLGAARPGAVDEELTSRRARRGR